MKKKITIIIRTYNRYSQLSNLLTYYKLSRFPAIIRILDSSSVEMPIKLKQMIKKEKFDYHKFSNNISPIDKLSQGIKKVNTPYVVISPDDDFITVLGIKAAIDFLENNFDYSSAQGRYIRFEGNNFDSALPTYYHSRNMDIDDSFAGDRIIRQFSQYIHYFFAVQRTEILETFLDIILSSGTIPVRMGIFIELLNVYVPLIFGKHKILPVFYCARECIPQEQKRTFLSVKEIIANIECSDQYFYFIKALTILLSKKAKISKQKAEKYILSGVDAYLNIWRPLYVKGIHRMVVPLEKLKEEKGYPFFDNEEDKREWESIRKIIY